jgi:hypothetical protein
MAAWLVSSQQAVSANGSDVHQPPTWERVNRAAHNLKSGDPIAAGALVDAVFADHGIDPAVSVFAPTTKDRLVRAEVDFQNGKTKGITEDKVAATVNQLADRFGAPAYAHTDVNEVKQLRVRMLTLYPSLIGRGSAATRDDSKPHFEATMSPIEAFHVTATMIHQKVFNPDFQLSKQERQDKSLQDNSGDSPRAKRNSHGERTREMLGVVQQGAATMSVTDMFDQCSHSLDLLGVEGEGK